MPLKLLPHKSWNVYNTANIERVRRDEAAAQAAQEEEDRRQDARDAERRIAILRGERVSSEPKAGSESGSQVAAQLQSRIQKEDGPEIKGSTRDHGDDEARRNARKRRRLAGEDDTDRDIRVARLEEEERRAAAESSHLQLRKKDNKGAADAPITDQAGHINLFPVDERAAMEKGKRRGNSEYEKEKERKERELEDQYTMRF
ncbi:hypothetical protein K490DRAFT_60753, partial [Saccharata proteae CBS 121410]